MLTEHDIQELSRLEKAAEPAPRLEPTMKNSGWVRSDTYRGAHREYLKEVVRTGSDDNETEVTLAHDALTVLNEYGWLKNDNARLLEENRRIKSENESYWLALAFIKNHGSHDQAVLRAIAAHTLALSPTAANTESEGST